MRFILIDKTGHKQVVDTKYDIGDTVLIVDRKEGVESIGYRPLLCDLVKDKYTPEEHWPIKVAIRYTITDIDVSAAVGVVRYSLHYSNSGVVFPSGSRCAAEADILCKVDSNDYETDPTVIEWCDKIKREELNMGEKFYWIHNPNEKNQFSGNRSLDKKDYDERKYDWKVALDDKVYVISKEWVISHARCPSGYTKETAPFMLISVAAIKRFIRENPVSNSKSLF